MSSIHSGSQSVDSSVQRSSALSISVGDTKSIVLALQALQSKIRQLEKDRDYHHNQYEQAIRSHEDFKSLLERKMEEERAIHRTREKELSELLRKALEEKTQIAAMGSGNRTALAQVREELELVMEAERKSSKEREHKLLLEIEELQKNIKNEKLAHSKTLSELQILKTRMESYSSSEKKKTLSATVERQDVDKKIISSEDSLVAPRETAKPSSSGRSSSDASLLPHRTQGEHSASRARQVSGRSSPQRRSSRSHLGQQSKTCLHHSPQENSKHSLYHSGRHSHHYSSGVRREDGTPSSRGGYGSSPPFEVEYINNYQDPTCNSLLRDVRNVSGLAPCLHSSYMSFSSEVPRRMRSNLGGRRNNSPEAFIAATPRGDGGAGGRSSLLQSPHNSILVSKTPSRQYSNSARQESRRSSQLTARVSPSRQRVQEVTEESLRYEIDDLHKRLNDFLISSSVSKLPVREMRYHFQKLATRLARKEEHLALLIRSSSFHRSTQTSRNQRQKESRQFFMNEMREIASNALRRY